MRQWQRRKVSRSSRPLCAAVLAAAGALLAARTAAARANGIVAAGCSGCHGSGSMATLSMVASPATFNPGDTVTMTLTIQWSSMKDAGAYISTGGVGTLRPISGEGLASNPVDGLTHTSPKPASGGQVTFRFTWQAPSTPGSVGVSVYALAGNGNNAPTGDAPADAIFGWVYGCQGQEYYWDGDGDGYGNGALGTRLACMGSVPAGYAAKNGDCDDNDQTVHPGVTEICNAKDDNCDGQVDENAPAVPLWPDPDGDGYYGQQTGTPKMGCAGIAGYAAAPGDCAPNDPAIHPGAKEVCNNKDDNCDGRVDEFVRPRCGTGWCERESGTCDARDCIPGPPHPEMCNLLDDDCDGEIDNGATCGAGLQCTSGTCVQPGGTGGTGGGNSTGVGNSLGTAGSGSNGSGAAGQASTGAGGGSSGGGGGSGGCQTAPPSGPSGSSLVLALLTLRRRRRGSLP